jgi:hypothetical protein
MCVSSVHVCGRVRCVGVCVACACVCSVVRSITHATMQTMSMDIEANRLLRHIPSPAASSSSPPSSGALTVPQSHVRVRSCPSPETGWREGGE